MLFSAKSAAVPVATVSVTLISCSALSEKAPAAMASVS